MITLLCLLLSAAMAVTPAPADMLAAEMTLTELSRHGSQARSSSVLDPGQCRRFQVNMFAEASQGYRLAGYPDVTLFMPDEHAPTDVSGRPVGSCWDMPAVEMGNAYEEVARYDYDKDITPQENRQNVLRFLENVRAGDVMQMLATYSNGRRGTHTLMFTRPYDPRLGMLYWADSNFANTRIDGVRYGYVRAYQAFPLEDVITWLAADWNNGATLYRLRGDIVAK